MESESHNETPIVQIQDQEQKAPTLPSLQQVRAQLISMPVTNENQALNIMVSYLNICQRSGIFSLEESAKIFECIKIFQKI
jgi:hypothetical protein